MRRIFATLVLTVLVGAPAAWGCSSDDAGSGEPAQDTQQSQELVPRQGQVIVTGLADRVVADPAQSEPVAVPFTITARERGAANLTIENAMVGGRRVAINWNGGTPLNVSGGGALDLGAAPMEAAGAGVIWNIDGAARAFRPGNYRIAGPVGVAEGGLATPRESVDFQADERTLLTARGGTQLRLPPRRIELDGPGTITLSGQLEVRTPAGEEPASRAELRNSPYQVTLVPEGVKLRVEAILQGAVSSS